MLSFDLVIPFLISSQALSKVIKKIENELDILLFTRTSQGLMH